MPVFIVILSVAILGGGYFFFSSKDVASPTTNSAPLAAENPEASPAPVTPDSPVPAPVAPMAGKKKYFDGQYSAEASYVIPNKEVEKITVSLTLKDGIITAADFTGHPVEQGSIFNQGKFRDGFVSEVVGKDIDAVALTVVNGASLTPQGFMSALEAIKVKAQTKA